MKPSDETPHGKLRVSLPRHSGLFEPVITDFMRRYPAVELDLDFSDRLVDVIGEGFDAAIRTGALADSGLKRRQLGTFRRVLVGAPEYTGSRNILWIFRHTSACITAFLVQVVSNNGRSRQRLTKTPTTFHSH
ncbi:LysR substrate-binding domain-containing protein [Pectobacterium polonicum]|uniref:LysR substrate-binding domain-containing protein n=1 Tax=Pectobacterium polonicum TaxID=2485124 RepID=UPI0030811618